MSMIPQTKSPAGNIWFTADHHFGHLNIIKYCNRPFSSVEEMDAEMIRRWNEKVEPRDSVFHLGDFTLNGFEYAEKIFASLNGYIWLVPGHHDKRWIKEWGDEDFLFGKSAGVCLEDKNAKVEYGGKVFLLSHRPPLLLDEIKIPPGMEMELVHNEFFLHGHNHKQKEPRRGGCLNIGVDLWDYYPVSGEQVLEIMDAS